MKELSEDRKPELQDFSSVLWFLLQSTIIATPAMNCHPPPSSSHPTVDRERNFRSCCKQFANKT
eukprot:1874197-Amphidinium_carterae.1